MFNELDMLLSGHQFKKLYEKEYDAVIKKYNLKKIEIEILYFVSQCGSRDTAKDIAKLHCISKAHISNSVEDLTHKKYISVLEDSQDRRFIHLSLTEQAKPIIADIEVVRSRLSDIIFQNISEEEKETIMRVSRKIVKNISEELEI